MATPTPTVQAQVATAIAPLVAAVNALTLSFQKTSAPPPSVPVACKFVPSVPTVCKYVPPPIPEPMPPPSPIKPVFNGFVVGVEQQPPIYALSDTVTVDNFARWVSRGINTMVNCPDVNGVFDGKGWVTACRQYGFHYVIQANVVWDWASVNADPLCLAVTIIDEPNGGKMSVSDYTAAAVQVRTHTTKLILCTLDGAKEQWPDAGFEPQGYLQVADIGAADQYSCNRGTGHDSIVPNIQTLAANNKAWSEGKPFWLYVECSNQNLAAQGWPGPNARGPVPSEQDLICDTALANGVSGVIYFPQQVAGGDYGFIWDAMMVDNVTAMTAKNAVLCLRTK